MSGASFCPHTDADGCIEITESVYQPFQSGNSLFCNYFLADFFFLCSVNISFVLHIFEERYFFLKLLVTHDCRVITTANGVAFVCIFLIFHANHIRKVKRELRIVSSMERQMDFWCTI